MMKRVQISILAVILVFVSHEIKAQFPSNVREITSIPNKSVSVKGNLSEGFIMEDLSWASTSSNACFPATQNAKFRGNHVLYGTVIPPYSEMTITVIPDDKSANFSIYGYQVGTSNYSVVPNLQSCVACEAEHKWDYQKVGKTQDHTRSIYFNSIEGSYNIFIGVVGANGLQTGGYTLKIDLVSQEDNSANQKPLKMYTAKSEKGKALGYKGDLKDGVKIYDLSWASKSNVACFPGTQNTKFNGNHIIYITELPANSNMAITVVPDDPKKNMSIYAYTTLPGNTDMVPNLGSCIECEAEHKWDYQKRGKTQDHTRTVNLSSMGSDYRVVIGVAGADGLDNGSFVIKIKTE
jgi:hypothetical protein